MQSTSPSPPAAFARRPVPTTVSVVTAITVVATGALQRAKLFLMSNSTEGVFRPGQQVKMTPPPGAPVTIFIYQEMPSEKMGGTYLYPVGVCLFDGKGRTSPFQDPRDRTRVLGTLQSTSQLPPVPPQWSRRVNAVMKGVALSDSTLRNSLLAGKFLMSSVPMPLSGAQHVATSDAPSLLMRVDNMDEVFNTLFELATAFFPIMPGDSLATMVARMVVCSTNTQIYSPDYVTGTTTDTPALGECWNLLVPTELPIPMVAGDCEDFALTAAILFYLMQAADPTTLSPRNRRLWKAMQDLIVLNVVSGDIRPGSTLGHYFAVMMPACRASMHLKGTLPRCDTSTTPTMLLEFTAIIDPKTLTAREERLLGSPRMDLSLQGALINLSESMTADPRAPAGGSVSMFLTTTMLLQHYASTIRQLFVSASADRLLYPEGMEGALGFFGEASMSQLLNGGTCFDPIMAEPVDPRWAPPARERIEVLRSLDADCSGRPPVRGRPGNVAGSPPTGKIWSAVAFWEREAADAFRKKASGTLKGPKPGEVCKTSIGQRSTLLGGDRPLWIVWAWWDE